MSPPEMCPRRFAHGLKRHNLRPDRTRHGAHQPSKIVLEAGGAAPEPDPLDAAHGLEDGQIGTVDAEEHGLDDIDRELVQAREGVPCPFAIERQRQVEADLDVEPPDEGHEGFRLAEGRVPVA